MSKRPGFDPGSGVSYLSDRKTDQGGVFRFQLAVPLTGMILFSFSSFYFFSSFLADETRPNSIFKWVKSRAMDLAKGRNDARMATVWERILAWPNEVEKQTGADNDGRSPQGQRILRKPTRLERGNPDEFEIRDAGRRSEVTTEGKRFDLIAGTKSGCLAIRTGGGSCDASYKLHRSGELDKEAIATRTGSSRNRLIKDE